MRKVLLLLAVVVAVMGVTLLFHNNSQAEYPQYRYVNGYAYQEGGSLGNYPIQASSNGGSTWVDVAITNGSGYYSWDPNTGGSTIWPDGWIRMRVKDLCFRPADPKARPTDQPEWYYYSQSGLTTSVNVNSDYCD